MREIYMAIFPYLMIMIAVMVLVILFPGLGTWLPNKMIQ
jgi:TRAP-type mannitol/chloroaromatic compound transport system permease large subunit